MGNYSNSGKHDYYRAGLINQNGMLVEIMQAAFIVLNMAILIYEKKRGGLPRLRHIHKIIHSRSAG